MKKGSAGEIKEVMNKAQEIYRDLCERVLEPSRPEVGTKIGTYNKRCANKWKAEFEQVNDVLLDVMLDVIFCVMLSVLNNHESIVPFPISPHSTLNPNINLPPA